MRSLRIASWIQATFINLGVLGTVVVYIDASGRGFYAVGAVGVIVLLPVVGAVCGFLLALPFAIVGLACGIKTRSVGAIVLASVYVLVAVGIVAGLSGP